MIIIAGITVILFATESSAADLMGVDIHGYISQGYLTNSETDFSQDSNNDSFAFNEVGINFGNQLNENLRFGIQFFAKDFSDMGTNDITVDWAYADYRFHQLLGFRVGQLKTPHGLYNEIRDIDMLRNPIFLPESVYQELSHDLYTQDIYMAIQGISSRDLYLSLQGIGIYGYIDMNMAGGLSYQVAYGTQNISTNEDIGRRQVEMFISQMPADLITSDTIENNNVEVDYKYAGGIIWDTPFEGLRFGASLDNVKLTAYSRFTEDLVINSIPLVSAGDIASVDYKKLENRVYSVEYSWNNLMLMTEFIQTTKEYEINLASLGESKKSDSWGWYVGGAYRLIDWMEFGGYFSQTRNDKTETGMFLPEPDYFSEFDNICATIRFDLNEYWTLKLEGHRFRGVYSTPEWDVVLNPVYNSVEETWEMFVVKTTVAF